MSSYRVEFKVPGESRWQPAYGTYSTEEDARRAMFDNKREIRAEGNLVGHFRVRPGRGKSPTAIGWTQWLLLGVAGLVILKASRD